MKKIFTLATAVLMTMAVMAADHRPSVTLIGGKNYEVVIDGRTIQMNQYGQFSKNQFGSIELNNLRNGKHTITVYEIPRRFFVIKSKRVVSSTSFILRGNDIGIRIDQGGQVKVTESRMNKRFD